MTYKSASHKLFYQSVTVLLFLVCFVSISQAQIPQYVMLDPIPMSSPQSIAIDERERVYVINGSSLVVMDQSGDTIPTSFIGASPPSALSVGTDNSGRIYIGNSTFSGEDQNVEVYSFIDENTLSKLYNLGAVSGDFTRPSDIEADSTSGNVYIVDTAENIVKVYNPDNPNTPGDPSDSFKFSFDGTANGGGQFNSPTSIAIDKATGEIIVLDKPILPGGSEGARIQLFNTAGEYISGFDKHGDQTGELWRPMHVAVDSLGRIYVTDSWQHIAHIYDKSGNYLETVFSVNTLLSALCIAISDSNNIYVGSQNMKRLERFGLLDYTQMDVSPSSLSFTGQRGYAPPAAQNIDISNGGTAILEWTASADEDWIDISDVSGSTGASSISTINISVDMTDLLAGSYAGVLTITSVTGATEEIDVALEVEDVPLVANACVQGDATPCTYEGMEGQPITLDASASDGNIVYYNWDIDGNGTNYEYIDKTLPLQTHTYNSDGPYNITLKVVDDQGNEAYSYPLASIQDSIPAANFTGSPTTGVPGLNVNFTNVSTGHDMPLVYEWDFDNDGTPDSTETNPSHVYADAGVYTVTLKVTDDDSSENTLTRTGYITVLNEHALSVTMNGGGAGTVNSMPQGINCGGDCSESYAEGTEVTLAAVPDAGSYFTGWSGGGCSGMDNCVVTVSLATEITASFENCANLPVRIIGTVPAYYSTIEEAYSFAVDGDTIQSQAARFITAPDLNAQKNVIIEGGFSCDYSPDNGYTILPGKTIVGDGYVTMGGFIFE